MYSITGYERLGLQEAVSDHSSIQGCGHRVADEWKTEQKSRLGKKSEMMKGLWQLKEIKEEGKKTKESDREQRLDEEEQRKITGKTESKFWNDNWCLN